MGGQFETYGPFPMPHNRGDVEEQQVIEWFEQLDSKHPGLPRAVGIYIICSELRSANLLPLYVGKTIKGFLKRFKQHSRLKKGFGGLQQAAGKGLVVFFIALSSGKRPFRKAVTGKNKVLAIDVVEKMIIHDCVKLNRDLLNVSNKTLYKTLSIPGYVGSKKLDTAASAKALANLFAND